MRQNVKRATSVRNTIDEGKSNPSLLEYFIIDSPAVMIPNLPKLLFYGRSSEILTRCRLLLFGDGNHLPDSDCLRVAEGKNEGVEETCIISFYHDGTFLSAMTGI
jgi:hypothetical protein